MTRKAFSIAVILLSLCLSAFAAEITFSGGYTKVSMQDGQRTVQLSEGATINTKDIQLKANNVDIHGENYSLVSCTGDVSVEVQDQQISLVTPKLFYDRTEGIMSCDSWIEIQDSQNQAALSGSWFEYDIENQIIKLQVMAKIVKVTDDGPMVCRAESIELDNKAKTVTMTGDASVSWNNDSYSASVIVVDLETNDISMYGSITGEVNG